MIQIVLGALEISGDMKEEWQRLLNINAPLKVVVGGESIIDDPSFPVVELAAELKRWQPPAGGFEYLSMEADVSPLLLIPSTQAYYVASPLTGRCAGETVEKEELLAAVNSFVKEVETRLAKHGIPLSE